jgi:copper transport protein
MRRSFAALLTLVLLTVMVSVRPAWAHANLISSDPAPNTALERAPALITLRFTEPLEPRFSGIVLRNAQGDLVSTPASTIDPTDAQVMSLAPEELADGLYTVSWRSLSAADGHQSAGSFSFAVGTAAFSAALASDEETVPLLDAALRTFDLLSLSLLIGGVGFVLFQSRVASFGMHARRLLWIGWGMAGVATLLLLPYQLTQATGQPLPEAFPSLGVLITNTRFGAIWIARMVGWALVGLALRRRWDWLAFVLGALILLARSLNSHSSAMHDPTAMVLTDWLHLLATVLWVGGLTQFVNVAIPLRRETAALAALVGVFSNYVRLSVAALAFTGLYLGWMHVGTLEALLGTLYGRALLVKIVLFAPLLGIAAVNLLVTHRRLQAGQALWAGRFRGLLGAEITLALGILFAVGVLTSLNPARQVVASRQPAPDNTISQFQIVDDIHIHFDVSPGWVGTNGFFITLYEADATPINDVMLIRIRLDNLSRNLGQTEIRPQHAGDGEYHAYGANLGVSGSWRARVTIARPDKFDVLADFMLDLTLPPIPEGLDMSQPLTGHYVAELLVGLALLALGGVAGVRAKIWIFSPLGLLATVVIVVGIVCLTSAISHLGAI